MKLGLAPLAIAALCCGSALACANAVNNGVYGNLADGGDAGKTGDGGSVESPDDPPHALGVIRLAETHTAGSTSNSTPSVTAAFTPEAKDVKTCGRDIDGCTIVATPKCGDDAGFSGCETGQVCTLDENCESVCKPLPECDPTCDSEHVCQIVGTRSKCVPKVDFNAGIVTLSGDGVSKTITLRPPYNYTASGDSPFVPESDIKVSASGATETGFAKFTDTFTATAFIETSPPLQKLDPAKFFDETGPVTVGWKAGSGDLKITLTGNKGSAVCTADDSSGTFDITRKVIRQVWEDDGSSFSSPSISVSIGRSTTKVKKDCTTTGTVEGVDIPPVGFARFITESIETFTVQGCASGQKSCPTTSGTGTTCTNVLTDSYNCGDCGVKCNTSIEYCSSGQCI
jgi:hypothetical protein